MPGATALRRILLIVALLGSALLSGATSRWVAAAATPVATDEFTIVAIPDTQHYARTATENVIYAQQTQWIANSQASLHTVFVTHLGDIVENVGTEAEWQRADQDMATLDTAGLKVGIAPGNHDLVTSTGAATLYDKYFPPSRYSANAWYGGYLGAGQPHVIAGDPERLNKDNFETFSVNGLNFIVIELEYGMPTYAVAWAGRVLDAHPDYRAIISTHAFLDENGTRPTSYNVSRVGSTSPANVWTQLINTHCNVFLVVNGHYHNGDTASSGEARRTDTNSCGKPVHQILSDYQDRGPNQNGEGRLRYYVFNKAQNQIRAYTYNPVTDTYDTDDSSQFSLSYDMSSGSPVATVPGAPTGATATAGNATAQMSWTAPASNGGSPITGYVVTPYVGSVAQPATAVGNVTSTPVSGLTNGTAYTFKVAAQNIVGSGTQSAASNVVTPQAAPSAWTAYIDPYATGSGTAANALSLIPPNGTTCSTPCDPFPSADTFTLKNFADGSALAGVQLQVDASVDIVSVNGATPTSGDGNNVFNTRVSGAGVYKLTNASGQRFDLLFTGLDSTKSYTITLTANRGATSGANAVRWSRFSLTGAGAWSNASSSGTVSSGDGSQVWFNTGNNGTRGYVAKWTNVTTGGDDRFSVQTSYIAAPSGTTDTGSYGPSMVKLDQVDATPTVPGTPGAPTATAGNASAQVGWSAPTSNGGSLITGYVVTPYIGSTAQSSTVVGNLTSTPVAGLLNGTAYTFRVAATNAIGTGAASAASGAVTPQAPATGTWVDAWGRSPLSTTVTTSSTTVQSTVPSQITNQTIRLIAWTTVGGSQVRVKLTNQFSTAPLVVSAAHVARRQSGGTITSGTDRVLTFGGSASVTIAAGAEVWSDPVTLTVPAHTDLAISLYLPGTFTPKTFHPTGLKTSYLSPTGNFTASATMPVPTGSATRTTTQVLFVSEVQVLAAGPAMTIVAIGDSITDGACASNDTNGSWPDLLSARLSALPDGTSVSVVNAGIGSNRFQASDGAGLSGIHRLPELLTRPAVEWVILFEGVNDISYEHATAAQIIAAYQDAIAQAHAVGVRVIGIPILPIRHSTKDVGTNEATREAVNDWIRTSGAYDRIIDFEPAMADPADPLSLRSSLTCDHVHPNAAGYKAMANSIDLSVFN